MIFSDRCWVLHPHFWVLVLNVLLAWPDTCFRAEEAIHPRTKQLLAFVPPIFNDDDISPKEAELVRICKENKAVGRKVLAYTVYTGKRDTTTRLKTLLQAAGLKVAVLRASVSTDSREDWIMDQVDRGIDVLVCNPELVKTGLDLLDFPLHPHFWVDHLLSSVGLQCLYGPTSIAAFLAHWPETTREGVLSRL